jgi:hypothetical protein
MTILSRRYLSDEYNNVPVEFKYSDGMILRRTFYTYPGEWIYSTPEGEQGKIDDTVERPEARRIALKIINH